MHDSYAQTWIRQQILIRIRSFWSDHVAIYALPYRLMDGHVPPSFASLLMPPLTILFYRWKSKWHPAMPYISKFMKDKTEQIIAQVRGNVALYDHNHQDDYLCRLCAGYVCVAIIHQTLTGTTGFLSCAQMLMHVIAHGGVWTPKESLHYVTIMVKLKVQILCSLQQQQQQQKRRRKERIRIVKKSQHVCVHVTLSRLWSVIPHDHQVQLQPCFFFFSQRPKQKYLFAITCKKNIKNCKEEVEEQNRRRKKQIHVYPHNHSHTCGPPFGRMTPNWIRGGNACFQSPNQPYFFYLTINFFIPWPEKRKQSVLEQTIKLALAKKKKKIPTYSFFVCVWPETRNR